MGIGGSSLRFHMLQAYVSCMRLRQMMPGYNPTPDTVLFKDEDALRHILKLSPVVAAPYSFADDNST
jgi:hypothetical protein